MWNHLRSYLSISNYINLCKIIKKPWLALPLYIKKKEVFSIYTFLMSPRPGLRCPCRWRRGGWPCRGWEWPESAGSWRAPPTPDSRDSWPLRAGRRRRWSRRLWTGWACWWSWSEWSGTRGTGTGPAGSCRRLAFVRARWRCSTLCVRAVGKQNVKNVIWR